MTDLVTTHTPGPWIVDPNASCLIEPVDRTRTIASTRTCGDRGEIHEENKANAAFIVRACNSYDELLAACKDLLSFEYHYAGIICQKGQPHITRCMCQECIEGRSRSAVQKAEADL